VPALTNVRRLAQGEIARRRHRRQRRLGHGQREAEEGSDPPPPDLARLA
jgi:hypothetical protein